MFSTNPSWMSAAGLSPQTAAEPEPERDRRSVGTKPSGGMKFVASIEADLAQLGSSFLSPGARDVVLAMNTEALRTRETVWAKLVLWLSGASTPKMIDVHTVTLSPLCSQTPVDTE